MKVLYITNIPSPYRVAFFAEMSRYCELTVIYDRNTASNRDKNWKGARRDEEAFRSIVLKGLPIGKELSFAPSIISYLKEDYDYIIVGVYSSPTAMLAVEYLKWKKIPFILNADGGFPKTDKWLAGKVKRHFIGSACHWICSGKATADYLKYYGAKADQIDVYPFTSLKSEQLYQPTPEEKKSAKRKLGVSENYIVLAIGRFVHFKGFDLLIQSGLEFPPHTALMIVGGERNDEYERIILESGIRNVSFIPFMTWDKLKEYYIAADVFVCPSREEVWGLVINEAMSYGLPVVASKYSNAGLELIHHNENGMLVDPNNTKAMGACISELLRDTDKAENMGQAAYRCMELYTIEKMAAKHIDIFMSLNDKFRRSG